VTLRMSLLPLLPIELDVLVLCPRLSSGDHCVGLMDTL
jgi:hypothetical protein